MRHRLLLNQDFFLRKLDFNRFNMLSFKMKIIVNGKPVELSKTADVFEALAAVKINPETVLVKKGGCLIPHDQRLKSGDMLELVTVISGG